MRKKIRIDVIRRRLAQVGIEHRWQGGTIIRTVSCKDHLRREEPMHYLITTEDQAAAWDAHHVLERGETLAERWDRWLP